MLRTCSQSQKLYQGCQMDVTHISNSTLTFLIYRDRVKPLFYTRMRQGEFDPPSMVPYQKIDMSEVQSAKHQELAVVSAMRTFVLLKNNGTHLPLKGKLSKLAVSTFKIFTARIQGMGKVIVSVCLSVHTHPIILPLVPCPFQRGYPSPSHNTSTGPMSFPEGIPVTSPRSLPRGYPNS